MQENGRGRTRIGIQEPRPPRRPPSLRRLGTGSLAVKRDPDADEDLHGACKDELVAVLRRSLGSRAFANQSEAAKTLGIAQSDLSRLLSAEPARFSVWRIVCMLARLGHDVTFTIRPTPDGSKGAVKVFDASDL